MKANSLFLLMLAPTTLSAETFYYGNKARTIELRSVDTTLLRFENPPLSAACHPGLIEFEPLDKAQASVSELEHLKSEEALPTGEDKTKNLIKAQPLSSNGTADCTFTLLGGEEVPVTFELSDTIHRPLISFKSINSRSEPGDGIDEPLLILRSLVEGNSLALSDLTHEIKPCQIKESRRSCRKSVVETPTAHYEIVYFGSNGKVSGWTIQATMKIQASFNRVADFKANDHLLYYSLSTPQQESYAIGQVLTHYLVGASNLSKSELERILP